MALTLHVEWSCIVCSRAGSSDNFLLIFSCMTLACSRHSESTAQCSDGGENVKSYAGKRGEKRFSPLIFPSSIFFFPALLSGRLELASRSFCSLHVFYLFMENCVLLSSNKWKYLKIKIKIQVPRTEQGK